MEYMTQSVSGMGVCDAAEWQVVVPARQRFRLSQKHARMLTQLVAMLAFFVMWQGIHSPHRVASVSSAATDKCMRHH